MAFKLKWKLLLRRLAANFYDLLLVAAILLIGTALALVITKGQAIPPGNFFYQVYLITLVASFYLWFWCHGGQTIGLAAWKLRVVKSNQQKITWQRACLRFGLGLLVFATGGLGLLWLLIDKGGLALHDRFSGTRLVLS